MNALLVIDMQNAWLNGATQRHDKHGVIERINRVAREMRNRGEPIIFIYHTDAEALTGSPAWQVDSALRIEADDQNSEKTACDAFAGTDLGEQLRAVGVDTLYLCGLATEFCVDTTLRAALSQGFNVVALADAHTTGDRPHLTAPQIIEHHNWTWTNLAVPKGRTIAVTTCALAFPEPA